MQTEQNLLMGILQKSHFIDGQALSPTDFGEFDEDSGIWKPINTLVHMARMVFI
jgi:hypothetical protein